MARRKGEQPVSAGQVFTALTGREADVSGQDGGDLRGKLLAVGGASSRTKSGIDLSRAAKRLGVSRRTVERWVKTSEQGEGQRPSKAHAKALRDKSRQAASTKRGRAQESEAIRKKFSRGTKLNVTANQGPHSSDYMRHRTVSENLSPEQTEAMINAWEEGGEAGFHQWAQAHLDDKYVDDWKIGQVENIWFGDE